MELIISLREAQLDAQVLMMPGVGSFAKRRQLGDMLLRRIIFAMIQPGTDLVIHEYAKVAQVLIDAGLYGMEAAENEEDSGYVNVHVEMFMHVQALIDTVKRQHAEHWPDEHCELCYKTRQLEISLNG